MVLLVNISNIDWMHAWSFLNLGPIKHSRCFIYTYVLLTWSSTDESLLKDSSMLPDVDTIVRLGIRVPVNATRERKPLEGSVGLSCAKLVTAKSCCGP